MLSDGIQHFSDIPDRAVVLVPAGLLLSWLVFQLRSGTGPKELVLSRATGGVAVLALGLFFGLPLLAPAAPAGGHAHGAVVAEPAAAHGHAAPAGAEHVDTAHARADAGHAAADAGHAAADTHAPADRGARSHRPGARVRRRGGRRDDAGRGDHRGHLRRRPRGRPRRARGADGGPGRRVAVRLTVGHVPAPWPVRALLAVVAASALPGCSGSTCGALPALRYERDAAPSGVRRPAAQRDGRPQGTEQADEDVHALDRQVYDLEQTC